MEFNDNAYNKRMNGVVEGVYYTQQDRVDELNERMFSRNLASAPMKPNFDPRPIPTKYSLFPIVDRRKTINPPSDNYSEYNVSSSFNPGNGRGPVNGFINNVDVDTLLRNQYFALQKGADQSVYVPNSDSDLYRVSIPVNTQRIEEQPYPDLFQQYELDKSLHPNIVNQSYIGNNLFFNHTRTQLRGGEQ
uniref:Uncharacterized protein n=1 Tax=viral metagenome TaxID=1070528 RepID=A0A6C0DRF1_9ZZZZ